MTSGLLAAGHWLSFADSTRVLDEIVEADAAIAAGDPDLIAALEIRGPMFAFAV